MRRIRVLVVDDDTAIRKYVSANLEAEGYEVLLAVDGAGALAIAEKELPDLIVLDIMMPGINGFKVCQRLREWSKVPIIMLSARGDENDKVKCLDLGADDYISKPFGVNELLARVRAVLRRTETAPASPPEYSFGGGGLKISLAERCVTAAGREVKLTPTEYNLLQELVLNANKVLTHAHLLHKVWGPEYGDEREYVHVFVGRLRKAIEPDAENPRYIVTVPGVGYRFETPK